MNIPSDQNRRKSDDTSLEHFSQLVSYLKTHLKQIPFNFTTIAQDLNWPVDRVHEMFLIIRDLYQLFRAQENILAEKMNELYLPKNDSGEPITLKLSINELQDLVDFHFLTSKAPQSLITLQKLPRLHKLMLNYPPLFRQEKGKGWCLSGAGKKAAVQFQQFQKLHVVPESIVVKGIIIEIEQNNGGN